MIERELQSFRQSPARLRDSELGTYIRDELDLQRALAIRSAESLARGELERLAREYGDHSEQLKRMAAGVSSHRPAHARAVPGQLAGVFDAPRSDDSIQWPFDGEYWKDEITTYHAVVVSRCAGD
jgi:hypothetical protein